MVSKLVVFAALHLVWIRARDGERKCGGGGTREDLGLQRRMATASRVGMLWGAPQEKACSSTLCALENSAETGQPAELLVPVSSHSHVVALGS